MRVQVFVPMKVQVIVFWVVTPCSDIVSYHITTLGLLLDHGPVGRTQAVADSIGELALYPQLGREWELF